MTKHCPVLLSLVCMLLNLKENNLAGETYKLVNSLRRQRLWAKLAATGVGWQFTARSRAGGFWQKLKNVFQLEQIRNKIPKDAHPNGNPSLGKIHNFSMKRTNLRPARVKSQRFLSEELGYLKKINDLFWVCLYWLWHEIFIYTTQTKKINTCFLV